MQTIFKAITGSSGHAFWWERTVLHSTETTFDTGLVAGKGTYHGTLRCRALPSKENRTCQGSSDQLRGFCSRLLSRLLSAVLSFPPRGVTRSSRYRFKYDLHLKIPSHLDRESIYNGQLHFVFPSSLSEKNRPTGFVKHESILYGPITP